MPEDGQKDRNM